MLTYVPLADEDLAWRAARALTPPGGDVSRLPSQSRTLLAFSASADRTDVVVMADVFNDSGSPTSVGPNLIVRLWGPRVDMLHGVLADGGLDEWWHALRFRWRVLGASDGPLADGRHGLSVWLPLTERLPTSQALELFDFLSQFPNHDKESDLWLAITAAP